MTITNRLVREDVLPRDRFFVCMRVVRVMWTNKLYCWRIDSSRDGPGVVDDSSGKTCSVTFVGLYSICPGQL